MTTFDLTGTCTQTQFGELVGIGQSAVSDLLTRNVIQPGHTAGQWLLDYTAHLREQAAGRGADGELAFQRSELARVTRERNEIKLEVERRTYAPVALLEQVLATVGRSIAGVLEPLHVTLHRMCPALTPEAVQLIQREVSKACDIAVTASLAVLDVDVEDEDVRPDAAEPEGLYDDQAE